ncbi:MAG: hypothetical protein RLY20_2962, partial [Verrucomicrobiota bacterium]
MTNTMTPANANGVGLRTSEAPFAAADGYADFAWIRASLNAGGTLTVKSILPGKTIFTARMAWP